MAASPHADYFAGISPEARSILETIVTLVAELIPGAQPCISYRMPAFRLPPEQGGKVFFYVAAFKQHVGVYPPVHDAQFRQELAAYANAKGNLAFPYTKPMPYALIGRVAAALASQYRVPRG